MSVRRVAASCDESFRPGGAATDHGGMTLAQPDPLTAVALLVAVANLVLLVACWRLPVPPVPALADQARTR